MFWKSLAAPATTGIAPGPGILPQAALGQRLWEVKPVNFNHVIFSLCAWFDNAPKPTVSTLVQVMFNAAAQLCSIFAGCSRLRDALVALCPDARRFIDYVNR